jgi:Domain of unknown function (DUF4124)
MRWAQRSAEISWCRSMLKLARALLMMLLIGQSAAFAQTSTAAKPTPSVSTSTTTTATKKLASSGEIYRWVDKNGKVQYGTDVPEESRAKARKVDTRSNIVSSQVPASISGAPQPMPANDAAVARQPISEREKCEAAWKKYNDSQACFAGYRQGTVKGRGNKSGSNISDEALEKCQTVTQPEPCR